MTYNDKWIILTIGTFLLMRALHRAVEAELARRRSREGRQ